MKVTQEKLPDSQIGLEIEIPSDLSKQTYERTLQNFTRSVNIPGFRKGKVPRHILIQRLGQERVKAAALEEIVQQGLQKAIEQESIEAIGNYQLRSNFEELLTQYQPGQPLTFSAKVDVPPQISLLKYEGLSVKAEEVLYDPQKVEEFFEQRRAEHATLIPVEDRPLQMGDVAVVDLEGKVVNEEGQDPEPFPGGSAEDFQVELSEGKFIPGFVEQMVGMQAEETRELSVKFPEDYGSPELAGKPAIFTVTVKEIKEKELPELDDDFAQEVSEFETMAELRESIENRYKSDAERKTKQNIHSALLKALLENVEVELPETLIRQEVDTILTQRAMQLGQYGIDVNQLYTEENIPQMRERARPEAVARIQQELALEEIAKLQSLEPEEAEIEQKMAEILEQLGDREVDPHRLRSFATADVKKEKALDWLQENAQVEMVPEGTLAPKEEESADSDEEAVAAEVEVVEDATEEE
ncbi:MAG TPA: trigger factor [Oscillatoriales cyanobacterium M59_W2019_021]|nr:MAG: trigger factor [Cyanobacteria bacterium J055]HIK31721.1 trigger factor [Oscillatoriales cyanobacterium M4454_W2019_049]HIK49640.1 trigger factor [Oscillatoriales cyanobacterium M59_W2019_021]